ncbi:hypothetical protein AVEN_89837-1 [Araneus ventricosus]|uniref:Uncharacterized protein n=1 Tax=Araneus ventricosus TaxID=182803 RepID=A0A4Y2MNL5_ARAVE|nr:hypothetical protein AVEN_89837-1 [Araneus ventricosus]
MSILPGSNLMRLFLVGLKEVQGLSWWGLDLENLKRQCIRAVLSIPGEMFRSVVKNVGTRCSVWSTRKLVTFKVVYAHVEEVISLNEVLWCSVISSLW